METRINYIAVGVFVIVLGFALIAAGLWIGTDITGRDYERYSVYFDESVAGLSPNANVTFRGVEVGRVADLQIDVDDPERVHVILEIERHTPIRSDTVAKLRMQGVTGIAEIELSGSTRQAPPLTAQPGEPYPVIASGPSLLSRLESALTTGMETLEQLAGSVSDLLAPQNIEALSGTFAHLERVTATLAANSDRIERSLSNAERMFARGAEATEQLGPTLAELQGALSAIQGMADTFNEAGTEFQRGSLPQLNRTVKEIHTLADSLSRLADELSDQPEMLLFGRPRQPRGPGE
jgi:phospholipid/cholesterol/gamma-HCH transport system substrate-binding protein